MKDNNLFQILGNIPPIAIGPGIARASDYKYSVGKTYTGINRIIHGIDKRLTKRRVTKHYVEGVINAFNIGYRLLDYSIAYGDGHLIHEAIERSGIDRKELFITTRVSNREQMDNNVRERFMRFLDTIKLDYVDLLQFHWPVTDCYLNTWKEMEKLYEEGYVKHLGVANCHQHHLEEIFKICKHRPEVGQIEIHPLFTQKPLIKYYQEHGILAEAYTPIARYDDRLMRLPALKQIAEKYNKTIVQIVLRWHVQNGVVPCVRSLTDEHQRENFDIFDFELTKDEIQRIDGFNINSRLRYDPDNCDFNIL